jgi:hypothetical protein
MQEHVPNFLPDPALLIEGFCAFRQAFDKLLATLPREIDDGDDDDDNSVNFIY